ncbi:patatin-like phospholipase family protein [Azospirillum argentinense]
MSDNVMPAMRRIGLALSGGGIRAAVFHLGVLKRLAEGGYLEQVSQISTVSGGSLVTGAIFAHAGGKWPSSQEFVESVYPTVRSMLVSEDLLSFRALGFWGAIRENVRIFYKRAHILAKLLQYRWLIKLKLSDLPVTPVWHINTTCIETGKNWRFSRDVMGDWRFGRHYSPDVLVAEAIAASAAVPYAIGALKLELPKDGWWRTNPATKDPIEKIEPKYRSVRLWDGGAYENMGLEALYKPAEGLQGCDVLMCSDASASLGAPKGILASLLTGSLASPRLFDIASDQIRSLRSRMLMKSIKENEIQGALFRIGTSARQFNLAPGEIAGRMTDEECVSCLNYRTDLARIEAHDFDRIARHGYEVADLTMAAYGKEQFLSIDKSTKQEKAEPVA